MLQSTNGEKKKETRRGKRRKTQKTEGNFPREKHREGNKQQEGERKRRPTHDVFI